MKKVITLILAFVLCMSMGMVAFASPVDPTIPAEKEIPRVWGGSGTDKDGNKVTASYVGTLKKEVEDMLKDDQKVKDILTDAGYVLKGDETVAVLGAGNIGIIDWETGEKLEVPAGGVDLEVALNPWNSDGTENADVTSLKNGDKLYVLHQKADGT